MAFSSWHNHQDFCLDHRQETAAAKAEGFHLHFVLARLLFTDIPANLPQAQSCS